MQVWRHRRDAKHATSNLTRGRVTWVWFEAERGDVDAVLSFRYSYNSSSSYFSRLLSELAVTLYRQGRHGRVPGGGEITGLCVSLQRVSLVFADLRNSQCSTGLRHGRSFQASTNQVPV